MSKVIKLNQQDIEKMVFNIVQEQLNETPMDEMEAPAVGDAPHSDEELSFGETTDGREYIFYKKGPGGEDVVVKRIPKH